MNIIRIFFTKTGEAAYISHLDLQRVMARALRISGMPVWYSQGFNPHIYMSFALPLPLGQQSLCECVDVKSEAEVEQCKAHMAALDAALPRGIGVTGIAAPKFAAGEIERAEYEFAFPNSKMAGEMAAWYNAQSEAKVIRKTKRSQQEMDLKRHLPKVTTGEEIGANCFVFQLPAGGEKHLNPGLLSDFFQSEAGIDGGSIEITRLKMYAEKSVPFL